MENKKMSVREVLEVTRELLRGIAVPVGMIESVGMPVEYAARNLDLCIEELGKAQETEKTEKTEEGPVDDAANG